MAPLVVHATPLCAPRCLCVTAGHIPCLGSPPLSDTLALLPQNIPLHLPCCIRRLARAAQARSREMQPHVRALLAALPADHWALPPTATWRAAMTEGGGHVSAMAGGKGHVAAAAGAAAGAGSGGREPEGVRLAVGAEAGVRA